MDRLFTIAFVLTSNDTTEAANTKKIKSVTLKIGKKTITKKTYSLEKGKKATIKVKVNPKKAKKSITYKSSNKKVATVSKKGVVTAKKKGTAKITVKVKGKNKKTKKTWVKIKVKNTANTKTSTNTNSSTNTTPPANTTPTPPANTTYAIKIEEINVADGENTIYGKIYMPQKEGKYPAIIMCHGYNGTNNDFVSECRYFAQNGYVACAFDFCGGSGGSKSSGSSTDMTIFTEKSNLLAVFEYIKTLDNVDTGQIFTFGGSQGGLVTALATEEIADEVKGMILYFPVFNIPDDWRNMWTYTDENTLPETFDFWGLQLGRGFITSIHDFDAYAHIGTYSKNVLILYGMKDAIVPYSAILKAKNIYKNCELITYPNDGHGFYPATANLAKQEVLNFMKKQ